MSPSGPDAEDVSHRYLAGESGDTIAAALGVSRDRVYRLLRQMGVERRRSGRPRLALAAEAVTALFGEGLTLTQIARRLGCSRPSVARVLVRSGEDLSLAAHRSRRRARSAAGHALSEGGPERRVLCVDRLSDGRYAVLFGEGTAALMAASRQKDAVSWARAFRSQSCPDAIIRIRRQPRGAR